MKIRLSKRLNLVPIAISVLLALGVFGSLAYVYANGAAALASADGWEKYQMSLEIDPYADYAHNESISSVYTCVDLRPVFVTADGVTVSGGEAWYNLIGEDAGGRSRYLMDVYTDEQSFDTVYSPLTGIRRCEPVEPEVIELTIDSVVQETVYDYMTAHGVSGCVYCYDYITGDTLCMVSTPGCASDSDMTALPEGALMNKCLYATPPGSTMKIVTLALLDKYAQVDDMVYTCDGSVELDGMRIDCTDVHGELDAAGAVGHSCNCWFAQAVYDNLTTEQVREGLKSLGWWDDSAKLSGVPLSPCRAGLNDTEWDFSSLWSLIGETTVEVNPVWMAKYAACTFTEAAEPRLTSDEMTRGSGLRVSPYIGEIWRTGFDRVVYNDVPYLTMGKTGTYEFDDGGAQKSYIGVSADLHVSFFITMENYRRDGETLDIRQQDVSRALLNTIHESKDG